jgi:hypothetical protein
MIAGIAVEALTSVCERGVKEGMGGVESGQDGFRF